MPAPADPWIEFRSLGAIEVRKLDRVGVTLVDIPPKYRALLAYLTLARPRDGFHARDIVAAHFWPEYDQKRARSNLRTAASELRRLLGPDVVITRGNEELRLNRDHLWCDAHALEAALQSGDLPKAVELYRGDLLPGMHLSDSASFERWLEDERSALRRRFLDALRKRAHSDLESGDMVAASRWHERILAVDPYDEAAVRNLMEARSRLGDRIGALQAYERFEQRLREDLELEPADETRRLLDQVRAMRTDGGMAGATAPVPSGAVLVPAGAPAGRPRQARGRIPRTVYLAVTLVGLGVLSAFAFLLDRDSSGSAGLAGAVPDSTIAVLPFEIHGGEDDLYREGIPSLLSMGLDGAAGLLAIDSRTVLARWDEQVPDDPIADLAANFEVARAAEARFAVIGEAVMSEPTVRITADVYRLANEERFGRATAEGPADSLLVLIDRLAVGVLQLIFEGRGDLPEIDLASLMTDSPRALTAYLEGEVFQRMANFDAAIEAYSRAVNLDSSFAMAHAQMAFVYFWEGKGVGRNGVGNMELATEQMERALRFADRLPEREALLVQATLHQVQYSTASIPGLRAAVRRHLDDAALWYRLGETYGHVPAATAPPETVENLFERAVRLDPRNAEYQIHHFQLALGFEPDSASAADRLALLERAAPDDELATSARLAFELAFGDPDTRTAAVARMSTTGVETLTLVSELLLHPRFRNAIEVDREIFRRGDSRQRFYWGLWYPYQRNVRWWGHLREGLSYLEHPEMSPDIRGIFYYRDFRLGLPIPDELLERALAVTLIDTINGNYGHVASIGLFAADQGRWDDFERAGGELDRRLQPLISAGDTAKTANWLVGTAMTLEAYGRWLREGPAAALPLLEDERTQIIWIAQEFLAQVYAELGRFRDAERIVHAYSIDPMQFEYIDPLHRRALASVYEALGEYDEAVESHEYFVTYWRDADPELQPLVEESRQAIMRLQTMARR